MEQELSHGMPLEPIAGDRASKIQWPRNPRLESLIRDRPEVGERLEKILRDPTLVAALQRATEKDPDALARDLEEGFRASFADLGDKVPTSIESIDFRTDASDTVDGAGTTGHARDYLMQRLMGTTGLADLAATMTLPSALQLSFEQEADKLATFLVALDRAKPPADERLAA